MAIKTTYTERLKDGAYKVLMLLGSLRLGLLIGYLVLRHVTAKLIICEEARQILGYLLSALLPGLEHLIQIGDHSQLRLDYTFCQWSIRQSLSA
jgi:hypothetical protein